MQHPLDLIPFPFQNTTFICCIPPWAFGKERAINLTNTLKTNKRGTITIKLVCSSYKIGLMDGGGGRGTLQNLSVAFCYMLASLLLFGNSYLQKQLCAFHWGDRKAKRFTPSLVIRIDCMQQMSCHLQDGLNQVSDDLDTLDSPSLPSLLRSQKRGKRGLGQCLDGRPLRLLHWPCNGKPLLNSSCLENPTRWRRPKENVTYGKKRQWFAQPLFFISSPPHIESDYRDVLF